MILLRISVVYLVCCSCFAAAYAPANPLLASQVPVTPGLLNGHNRIVVNQAAAIQLGKALFWDVNVGSDGMACASCHFHAGVDGRIRNQLSPGGQSNSGVTATTFETTASGNVGGPDYQLTPADFPLHQFADPASRYSDVIFQTDDVVGSAGVFLRQFQDTASSGDGIDTCAPASDNVFHIGNQNTRQVTARNAPSVINAIFNYRNFWDGRANNLFNGSSAFGNRDPDAGIWLIEKGKPVKKPLKLSNASLASLAVAPPLNTVEMSCVGRRFQHLAQKLLSRRALEAQDIHPQDSVLAAVRDASGKGLVATYQDLIKQAFAKRFWQGQGDFGFQATTAYPQMEANFAMFFGLAIQLYESTLISDQSKFDGQRDSRNYPVAYSAAENRGLEIFIGAECAACHIGPTFSAAAHPDVYRAKSAKKGLPHLVDRSTMFENLSGFGTASSLIDLGYMITSVSSPEQDIGLGGKDPFGNPLSFVEQYVASLAFPESKSMIDSVKVVACEFGSPFSGTELMEDPNSKSCKGSKRFSKVLTPDAAQTELTRPLQGRLMTNVNGAFKIPSLRNVELTGPYMHNGSMKSLEEVIEFYNRGGNNFHNPQHTETLVFPHGFNAQQKADLLAFLKTLTDDRVRWERAPFDHPSLPLPHGHDSASSAVGPSFAGDVFINLPAVGKSGRTVSQGPLRSFEENLLR